MKEFNLFEQWVGKIVNPFVAKPKLDEAKIEQVGREFQHIEDLAYIYGPEGAKKAIERLEHIAQDSSHMEVKWDGSPAIIFGRTEHGQFHFGDKYSKQYNTSAEELYKQYAGEGASEGRIQFAQEMAKLYPLYEQATPKEYRGFLECGLMYKNTPDLRNGEYVFQPNTVIYHVNAKTPLGQRIGQSTSGAAATGYFKVPPGMGGQREAVRDFNKPIGSKSVVIIPPKFVDVQAQVPQEKIDRVKRFLNDAQDRIMEFITPSNEWVATFQKPEKAGPDWRAAIYKYVNSQVDSPGALNQLGANMVKWAETDPIFSPRRRPIAIKKIQESQAGLRATFLVVRAIMHLKDLILHQIEEPTLGSMGIRAELPTGAKSGEGFVSDPHGGVQPLKFVNRAGFTAANRQMGQIGAARKAEVAESIERTGKNDTAVVSFGRGMGHKGHMYLASAVISTAKRLHADPYFYVSKTVGKDDPLLPEEKLKIYKKVFPEYSNIFRIADAELINLNGILHYLYEAGYKKVVVIVGEDQKKGFQYLANYNGKPNKDGNISYNFDKMAIISRQETNDEYAHEAGPRATPMREILKDPSASYEEKFATWRDAMPRALSDKEVKHFMNLAAQRMGVKSLKEADNPNYFGSNQSMSAIPGTPGDLSSNRPSKAQVHADRIEKKKLAKFMGHR